MHRVARLALAAVATLVAAACTRARSVDSVEGVPGASVVAKQIEAPSGVELVTACTPTGPELCFNAVDDNCNGVIDEGCGLNTGALQFTIAWGDSPADVDLVVTSPSGDRVSESNRFVASGLRLDRDCPGDGCGGQNVENVHCESAEPAAGRYLVEVRLGDLHGAETPVRVRFGARIGSRTYGSDVVLSRGEDRKTFAFTL